jgi:hypothetical protein
MGFLDVLLPSEFLLVSSFVEEPVYALGILLVF